MTSQHGEAEPAEVPKPKRRFRRNLIILVIAVIVSTVPLFFFQLHEIDGVSMWPFLDDGTWLIVRRNQELPGRFEPVVLKPSTHSERTVLKRVVAYGGESVFISEGDVLVNGRFLPRTDAQIAASLVPVFSLDLLGIRRRSGQPIIVGPLNEVAMTPTAGRISLTDDGRYFLLEGGLEPATVRVPHEMLRDDHIGSTGRWVAGREIVRDPVVTFSLYEMEPGRKLTLEHHVDGDVNTRLSLRRIATGFLVELEGAGFEQRFEQSLEVDLGTTFRLVMVDDRRLLEIETQGGEGEFESLIAGRRSVSRGVQKSWLSLHLDRGKATFSRLDIARDIHYTSPQLTVSYGVTDAFEVPLGQVYVLGDNSPESRDSRHWGGVEARDNTIGLPAAVIWPRRLARSLSSP